MTDQLAYSDLLVALESTGAKLDWPGVIEIAIVGGAAGMLLGLWPGERVTEDVDIAEISPPSQPRGALLLAAREMAEELGLSPHWLNDDFLSFGSLDTLPDGWRARSVRIGSYGNLRVICPCRRDLLAMKVYAGRPQDIEDVLSCATQLSAEDLAHIRAYLESLRASHRRNIAPEQLDRAFSVLEVLREERRS
ncbi:MAG: DUF6036 family nucleotidyltransferase [Phycisphaerae bacterium]